jgi:hypothetical protein
MDYNLRALEILGEIKGKKKRKEKRVKLTSRD